MKNALKIISIVMFLITGISLVLFVSTFFGNGGGGFIDLTNVVQYFLCAIAAIFGIIGIITAYYGWRNKK
ncbi:MAG: hypothetical protein E7482_01170 [Ruminococcaceae bacterium]|nr:hypothetical protein [Oscillospiraceae bacterium]